MKPTNVGLAVKARVFSTPKVRKQFKKGEFGAVLDWEVRDSNGKIVSSGARKSESFTEQFIQLLWLKFLNIYGGFSPLPVIDTSDITVEIFNSSVVFGTTALAADVTNGIIIGSGITAPTITDRHIETIIPHATMNYGIDTWGAPAADATTSQFTITRNFANVSGGNVTVNEIALYVRATSFLSKGSPPVGPVPGNPRYLMTIRDVIAGGIVVGNGQTLTINYRPQAVV